MRQASVAPAVAAASAMIWVMGAGTLGSLGCTPEQTPSAAGNDAGAYDLPALLPGTGVVATCHYRPITGLPRVLVYTPSREADRVVVPSRRGLNSPSLLHPVAATALQVSDDGGGSFRTIDPIGATERYVHTSAGRVFLVAPRATSP